MRNPIAPALILAAVLALIASGCVSHRPAEPDPGELPAAFSDAGGNDATAINADQRWWRSFNDPTLEKLIDRVLARNPDLDQAFARLNAATAAERAAVAQGEPQVNLAASLSRDQQPGVARPIEGSNYRLSASASYEVDLWGKFAARDRAAELDRQAAAEQFQTICIGLAAKTADNFYLATALRQQMDIQNRLIASLTDTVSMTENRYNEGLVTAAELYQAREALAAARGRLPALAKSLAQTENALAVLAGDYPGESSPTAAPSLPDPQASWPAGLPADLLKNRPDIRAASLAIQARDERLAAALADRFPSFNLLTTYGLAQTSMPQVAVGTLFSVAASLAAPIIDSGRRQAEIDRQQALLDESLALYRQVALEAFKEVENALVAIRSGEDRLARIREQLAIATDRRRLIADSHRQGLTTALDELVASRQIDELEVEQLLARRQLISDRISLIRSLGGAWPAVDLDRRQAEKTAN